MPYPIHVKPWLVETVVTWSGGLTRDMESRNG